MRSVHAISIVESMEGGIRPVPHGRQAGRTVGRDGLAGSLGYPTGGTSSAGRLTWLCRCKLPSSRGLRLELLIPAYAGPFLCSPASAAASSGALQPTGHGPLSNPAGSHTSLLLSALAPTQPSPHNSWSAASLQVQYCSAALLRSLFYLFWLLMSFFWLCTFC